MIATERQRGGRYKQSIIRICREAFTPETVSPSFLNISLSCAFVNVLTKATALWSSADWAVEAIIHARKMNAILGVSGRRQEA